MNELLDFFLMTLLWSHTIFALKLKVKRTSVYITLDFRNEKVHKIKIKFKYFIELALNTF